MHVLCFVPGQVGGAEEGVRGLPVGREALRFQDRRLPAAQYFLRRAGAYTYIYAENQAAGRKEGWRLFIMLTTMHWARATFSPMYM